MDAVLMCGGAGSRLDPSRHQEADEVSDPNRHQEAGEVGLESSDEAEKPLVPVGGVPMVERVRRALARSRAERVHAVVSPRTPRTRTWAESADCEVIEGTGEGYVADLDRALERADRPALTVAADLPLLAPATVDRALDEANGDSLAVCVPADLKRDLGASVDTSFERDGRELAPSGLNVVGEGEDRVVVWDDEGLAVNVNRPGDLELARELVE